MDRDQSPEQRAAVHHRDANRRDDRKESLLDDPRHDDEGCQAINEAARSDMICRSAENPQQSSADEDDPDHDFGHPFGMERKHESKQHAERTQVGQKMAEIRVQKRHGDDADQAPGRAWHQAELAQSRPDEKLQGITGDNEADQAGRENDPLAVCFCHRSSAGGRWMSCLKR